MNRPRLAVPRLPVNARRLENNVAGKPDVLVIGAGLAGLTAAWQALTMGKRVRLIAKGWGMTHWHAGCIDVMGEGVDDDGGISDSAGHAMAGTAAVQPDHPYAILGRPKLNEAIDSFAQLCRAYEYPLVGNAGKNWMLPSAVGAARPTYLAPETMIAGDLTDQRPMLIVGLSQLNDFYPGLMADNLNAQGIPAAAVTVDLASLREVRHLNPVMVANRFHSLTFLDEIADAIRPHLNGAERVGLPAVLGFEQPIRVKLELEQRLGCQLFEIPTLPPSVPGIRLHRILVQEIRRLGGVVQEGFEVVAAEISGSRVLRVFSEAGARQKSHAADVFVLATGGILGGGMVAAQTGDIKETIFGLPLSGVKAQQDWLSHEYFDPQGHAVFKTGIRVNRDFRPIDETGSQFAENLIVVGTTLAHCDPLRERSMEGIAVATGFWGGRQAASNESS